MSSTGLNNKQQQQGKKSSSDNKKHANKSKPGILVNKNEPKIAVALQQQPETEGNHFAEILPKDDVEMLKAHVS